VKAETDADAEQEPQEAEPIGLVSDMLEDNSTFRRAGLGFGEKESLILQTSLRVSLK
jgi:hypothetical protein